MGCWIRKWQPFFETLSFSWDNPNFVLFKFSSKWADKTIYCSAFSKLNAENITNNWRSWNCANFDHKYIQIGPLDRSLQAAKSASYLKCVKNHFFSLNVHSNYSTNKTATQCIWFWCYRSIFYEEFKHWTKPIG